MLNNHSIKTYKNKQHTKKKNVGGKCSPRDLTGRTRFTAANGKNNY